MQMCGGSLTTKAQRHKEGEDRSRLCLLGVLGVLVVDSDSALAALAGYLAGGPG
jgi:hypothetical protein